MADVKGDVSGLAAPGEAGGGAEKRMADLGLAFDPASFPVTPLALGGIGPGVPVRTTVSDFGPQLLAKVLDANETQESRLALVFHYADANGLPLLDLADLRALLTFLDGAREPEPAEPPPMEHVPVPKRPRAPAPRPAGGDAIGDFLTSRQGRALQRQVLRGVFGMLRKRL